MTYSSIKILCFQFIESKKLVTTNVPHLKLLYIGLPGQPKLRKKKDFLKIVFLIFRKIELSDSKVKSFLYFLKKAFFIFREMESLKKNFGALLSPC